MSLLMHKLYKAMKPCHLFDKKKREKSNCPSALLFSLIRGLSNFTALQILKSPNIEQTYNYFVEIAKLMMIELKNFSGGFAVFLGISQHAVSRLGLSLEPVLEEDFNVLQQVTEPTKNYAYYRSLLDEIPSEEPCIPYLGLTTQALTLLEELR